MASRGIDAPRLQHATTRNVSRWISTPSWLWYATRWCSSSRLSSLRILTATSWISSTNARSYAPTDARPHAPSNARPHAPSYARTHASSYARTHATSYAWDGSGLCSSCDDGWTFTNGCTRLLSVIGSTYDNLSSRFPRKAHASQDYQSTLPQVSRFWLEGCERQTMWKMRVQKMRRYWMVSAQKQALQKDET